VKALGFVDAVHVLACLARTHPVRARSSDTETLSRSRSLAYTIDTHEI